MKCLLVEDEAVLASLVTRQLADFGIVVEWVGDVETALHWPELESLDAIILDLGLPDMDGIELIRAWRTRRDAPPILVLSARSDWREKVACLNAGAEDYVVKPARGEELAARISVLARRTAERPLSDWLTMGGIRAHPELRIAEVDGREVPLTVMEFRLLMLLLKRQGRSVTQDEALDALYPLEAERQSNTIEAHIARLRRKIGRERIINQRGLGYRLGA